METQCNAAYLDFPVLGRREIAADFDGGDITSDGGALLLRQTEQLTAILRQFAAGFTDHRDPDRIEHTVADLVAQRVYPAFLTKWIRTLFGGSSMGSFPPPRDSGRLRRSVLAGGATRPAPCMAADESWSTRRRP